MGFRNDVGDRHTEFGGGPGHPQRKPDGTAAVLDADEKRRAFMAAGWDEIRGDVDAGVGLPVRPDWVERYVPNASETANGYAADIAALSETIAGRAGA